MTDIPDRLARHPFFAGLGPTDLATLSSCGAPVRFEADEVVFREGDPADHFYALDSGRVALQIHTAGRPPHLVTTLSGGDVLGASWMFPPHQWQFEALALDATAAIALDAACLRAACDADPALGYRLVQRFAAVLVKRLQATRIRLLDVYGDDT